MTEEAKEIVEPKPTSVPTADPQTHEEIVALIEALLFVGARPVSVDSVCRTFTSITAEAYHAALTSVRERYADPPRHLRLRETPEGMVLEIAPETRDEIQKRARSERGIKLPRPVVEVLSLVAYRQPITRDQLERKLGNDVRAILRKLLRQRLIETAPEKTEAKEDLYVTTSRFLEFFGLESPSDLPATDDIPPE